MDAPFTNDGTDKFSTTLYKYYKVDERFFTILTSNAVWFSDPFDFNDPYDCNLIIDSDNTYDEILGYLHEIRLKRPKQLEEFGKDTSEEAIFYSAKHWHQNPDRLREYLRRNQLNELERKGIACFSKSDKILLMWSHYAASHKGACITFDVLKDPDFFAYPFDVEYPSEYPKVNFIREKNRRKRYKHILAMKSKDWEYEQEVRIVKDKRDHARFREYVPFDKSCLTEIKFGYKADKEDIQKTRDILASGGYEHVGLYKAELIHGQFGLDFTKVG